LLALQGSRKRVVTAPAEGSASDTALDVAGPATGRAGAAKSSSAKRAAAAAATAIAAATSAAATSVAAAIAIAAFQLAYLTEGVRGIRHFQLHVPAEPRRVT
jgi:hypothetical protein